MGRRVVLASVRDERGAADEDAMRSREEGEGEPDTFTAAPLASRWRDTALQVAESREAGRGTWGTHLERLLTGEREAGSGGEWRDSVRGRGGDCVWSDADGSERVFAAGLRRQTASAEVEEAVHDPLLHPREEDEEAGRQGSEGDALRAGRTSAAVLERPPSKTKSRAVDGEHDRSRHVFGRESPCSAVDTSADGAEAADEGAHQSRDAGDDYTVTAAGASLPDESKALIPVAAKDRRVARRTIDRMQRWGVVVRDTALERMQRQRQHPMQTRPQEPSSSTENMEEMSPSSGVESDGLRVEVARTLLEALASGAPLWDAVATATATSVELASVRRHYSDFAWLEQRLVATHPVCIVPALPDAPRWLERYTSTADLYLERQRRRLERFLLRVLAHSVLQRDRQLHAFLGCFGDAVWARLRACQDGRQIEAVLDEANEALREEVAMDSTVRGAHTAGAADPGAALAGTASRSYLQWATHARAGGATTPIAAVRAASARDDLGAGGGAGGGDADGNGMGRAARRGGRVVYGVGRGGVARGTCRRRRAGRGASAGGTVCPERFGRRVAIVGGVSAAGGVSFWRTKRRPSPPRKRDGVGGEHFAWSRHSPPRNRPGVAHGVDVDIAAGVSVRLVVSGARPATCPAGIRRIPEPLPACAGAMVASARPAGAVAAALAGRRAGLAATAQQRQR
eukprot:ctg_1271.g310